LGILISPEFMALPALLKRDSVFYPGSSQGPKRE
jgi:hypothetical protein